MKKKIWKGVAVVVLCVAAVLAWQFVFRPRISYFQAWEGVIEDAYRVYNVEKVRPVAHRDEDAEYDYYWRIKRDDGEEVEVEVPRRLWGTVTVGHRVLKAQGKRWPEVVSERDGQGASTPTAAAPLSASPGAAP